MNTRTGTNTARATTGTAIITTTNTARATTIAKGTGPGPVSPAP